MFDERLKETAIPALAFVPLLLSVIGKCSEVEGIAAGDLERKMGTEIVNWGCEPEEEHFGEVERAGLRVRGREFVKSLRESVSAGAFEVRCEVELGPYAGLRGFVDGHVTDSLMQSHW